MPDPIELPGDIIVNPPPTPGVEVTPPPAPGIAVVPVQGPPGPQGPPGDTAQTLYFVHVQSTPATLVQIRHGLKFPTAGIVCLESDGTQIEYQAVTYPTPGITELAFGVSFTGTIYLS